jgi:hypothetical protein
MQTTKKSYKVIEVRVRRKRSNPLKPVFDFLGISSWNDVVHSLGFIGIIALWAWICCIIAR